MIRSLVKRIRLRLEDLLDNVLWRNWKPLASK